MIFLSMSPISFDIPDLQTREVASSRIGIATTLGDFPAHYKSGIIFMAVGRRGYVGLTRTEDGRLNIAAAVEGSALRGARGPAVACIEILNEAGLPITKGMLQADWRGTLPLTRRAYRRAAE
jgi:hypothetical protein